MLWSSGFVRKPEIWSLGGRFDVVELRICEMGR